MFGETVYEWDGAERAADHADQLVRLLVPLSTHGSVRYHVAPGIRRQDLLGGLALAGQERRSHDWMASGGTAPGDTGPFQVS